MLDDIAIGVNSWIIRDGNYGDFKVGDQPAFAVEFGLSEQAVVSVAGRRSLVKAVSTRPDTYAVTAEVVHVAAEWWAIDAGIILFSDGTPPPLAVRGAWLSGEISIGVDPFFYFERLHAEANAPACIYDWKIERILMQTAPLIETAPRRWERDPTKSGWKDIAATDAWNDDEAPDYVLICRCIPNPPRRLRETQWSGQSTCGP